MSDIIISQSTISGEFNSPEIGKYGGDYSFAGMFLARAALGSSVICNNLNPHSEQNGTVVLDILKAFGAKVTRSGNSVNVKAAKLKGCTVDLSEFIQISPMVSLLSLFATGKTRLCGFEKSPELLTLIVDNLKRLGARCEYNYNDLWLWPQKSVTHAVLDAKNDPYMSLALILISTYTKGETCIRNIDGFLQRYPEFEDVFSTLGGKYKICNLAL